MVFFLSLAPTGSVYWDIGDDVGPILMKGQSASFLAIFIPQGG